MCIKDTSSLALSIPSFFLDSFPYFLSNIMRKGYTPIPQYDQAGNPIAEDSHPAVTLERFKMWCAQLTSRDNDTTTREPLLNEKMPFSVPPPRRRKSYLSRSLKLAITLALLTSTALFASRFTMMYSFVSKCKLFIISKVSHLIADAYDDSNACE